jgi:urate oxidase
MRISTRLSVTKLRLRFLDQVSHIASGLTTLVTFVWHSVNVGAEYGRDSEEEKRLIRECEKEQRSSVYGKIKRASKKNN